MSAALPVLQDESPPIERRRQVASRDFVVGRAMVIWKFMFVVPENWTEVGPSV